MNYDGKHLKAGVWAQIAIFEADTRVLLTHISVGVGHWDFVLGEGR